MSANLQRHDRIRTSEPQNLPVQVPDQPQMVLVDTTWGTVQPLQPFPDVPTVGELEVIDLVAGGALLVDTRVGDSRSGTTLPGATHLPHDQVADRRSELDHSRTSPPVLQRTPVPPDPRRHRDPARCGLSAKFACLLPRRAARLGHTRLPD